MRSTYSSFFLLHCKYQLQADVSGAPGISVPKFSLPYIASWCCCRDQGTVLRSIQTYECSTIRHMPLVSWVLMSIKAQLYKEMVRHPLVGLHTFLSYSVFWDHQVLDCLSLARCSRGSLGFQTPFQQGVEAVPRNQGRNMRK